MAIPTITASMVGLHDPGNHQLGVHHDGLTGMISPFNPHGWEYDDALSDETNESRRKAAAARNRAQFLALMKGFQITYSYEVSRVVWRHPERAVNIPGSRVWVVVMPPPEREQPPRQDSSREDDCDDAMDMVDEDYMVVVLDGRGCVDLVEDGPVLLRQAHRNTGRPHSLYSMQIQGMQRRDPWNGKALADGEVVPNHLPEAVAVIGEMYLAQQRPGIGVSASLERAMAAVRALGGDSKELLERIINV
jgi:hypothetical protein